MSGQLLPPPELDAPVAEGLTSEQRIKQWLDLLDLGTGLVLEGIRRKVGPDGDWRGAFRSWQMEQFEDHDRAMRRLLEELSRRERPNGS
jgi:hypothetical protein